MSTGEMFINKDEYRTTGTLTVWTPLVCGNRSLLSRHQPAVMRTVDVCPPCNKY